MQSNNPFHDREVAARTAELAAAKPYIFLPPDAPEPTPTLADLPFIVDTKALRTRVRAANVNDGNRVLSLWCGELSETIERFEALERAERALVAELARLAAVKAVRVLPTVFGAADDVAIVTLASWPLNVLLEADGVAATLPTPICFIPKHEAPLFAAALERAQARHANRSDLSARDKRVAILLEDWSNARAVIGAFDPETATTSEGESALDGFIVGVKDPRVLVRWSATDAELASVFYERARQLADKANGMSLRAAREASRTLWPTLELEAAEPVTSGAQ